MRERLMWVRWVFLAIAVAVLVVFLVAQRQSQGVDVSYGQSPSDGDRVMEGDANEVTDHEIPSTADIQQRVDRDRIVILPGSVAHWDERRVSEALGDSDLRILVAPPGLSEDQKNQIDDVEGVHIQIVGTSVTGGILVAVNNTIAGWRAEYATGDVTNLLVTLIARELDAEDPQDIDLLDRRAITESELAAIVEDLSAGRPHIAAGATLETVPENANWAFPDAQLLVAAFPRQEFGESMPDYGAALHERFPGQPIVVMYGAWIEYHGPAAEEFAEIAAASYYAQFGGRLSRWDYPQQNVLHAYLNRVTDIRYSGIFDRALPYQPFDPLRVALPALPWLFGGSVLVFLAMSLRPILGSGAPPPRTAPARLAFLNTLAVEISGLSHDPSLVRGIKKLQAASSAIDDDLPRPHVTRLIGQAENDLDETARKLGREDLRPRNYVAGSDL
ncbi:hypothetical protein ONR57_15425 [Hoyosella sp. YIM 151337]|uniref:hypothetical protein n=1 Tax=Hoyosella sp. YIM 151337 TaxID=2992742 RepID=UPI002235EB5F|nr:hypothetical protein [Hoyosella sp. YIM 151337]MCW4354698.1 hypothetical protein [Hoyosella sp. YIM 151337]